MLILGSSISMSAQQLNANHGTCHVRDHLAKKGWVRSLQTKLLGLMAIAKEEGFIISIED